MALSTKHRATDDREGTVIVQEEAKPPPIKIRIISKPQPASSYFDLATVSNSQDALKLLLQLGNKVATLRDQTDNIVHILLEYYNKDFSPAVRVKIVMILSDFARVPGYDALPLCKDVLTLLSTEKSHKVKSELIKFLTVIGRSLSENADLHQQIVAAGKENLKDTDHSVRCACLNLIGSLNCSDMNIHETDKEVSTTMNGSIQEVLGTFTTDQDPRVRTAAFQSMLSLHQRGQKLSLSLYKKACTALKDDFEGVRIAAMNLIWTLSHLYPEEMIELPAGERKGYEEAERESIRLVDDGFAQICDMVNDLSVKVRAEAAGLLGSLHSVSMRFLEQTLDKKLMSQLRRKCTAHERQKEKYTSGQWSSGQQWGDDAPKENIDPETISCINQGACGAFVHGLEDEFFEVRTAAVDSLCELATQSPAFAVLSLDFLVDMFNDEIEGVRLNAIYSLRRISPHIVLREDQLEIVLNLLDDYSKEIREGLHEALSNVRLSTKSCLNRALHFLMRNLNKYPHDRLSIWNCLKHLGLAHPNLTHSLVPELLGTHPFFDTPEPDMDDPAYIAVMILIFNSTVKSPTMVSLFPDYVMRHYSYLRDSIPELVPEVPHISQSLSTGRQKSLSSFSCSQQDPVEFLRSVLAKVKCLEKMDHSAANDLMQLTISDLQRIGELQPKLAASAEYCALYLQCQLLLSKILNGDQMSLPLSLSSQQTEETTLAAVEKVINLTYKLQHLFIGNSMQEQAGILQIRLRAWTLQLVVRLREAIAGNSKVLNSSRLCEEYLKRLQYLNRHFLSHQLKPDSFTQALFSEMHKFDPSKSGILSKFLPSVLLHHSLPSLELGNMICRSRITILEPTGGSDNPLRFTARLTLALPLDVMLENVEDVQRIQIMVKFPDSEVQLFNPRISNFKQLGPLKYRLLTDIYLTHGVWTEPCQIDVSVVMSYNPRQLQKSSFTAASPITTNVNEKRTLALCSQPVKVYLMPKPPKLI